MKKNPVDLVVGGAGFVGQRLVSKLLKVAEARVVVVDNFLSSEPEFCLRGDKVTYFSLDGATVRIGSLIANDEYLRDIYNLACLHGNQSSIQNPIFDQQNSTNVMLNLLEQCGSISGLRSFVYTAAGCSMAPKDNLNNLPSKESDPPGMVHDSPYSISKLTNEMYGLWYHKERGVPFKTARFQNVYGPGEVLGAGLWRGTQASVWRNVVPTFIFKALAGDEISIFGEGDTSRDFIFVDDVASGLALISSRGKSGEAYNLGSGKMTTISELAEQVFKLAGRKPRINYLPQRSWDSSLSRSASTEKSERDLGFAASTSLSSGLVETINWTKNHLERINVHVAKHSVFQT